MLETSQIKKQIDKTISTHWEQLDLFNMDRSWGDTIRGLEYW